MSRGRPAHFSLAVMTTLQRGEYTVRQIAEINQAALRPVRDATNYLLRTGRIEVVGRAESSGGKPPSIFGRAIERQSNAELQKLHFAICRR